MQIIRRSGLRKVQATPTTSFIEYFFKEKKFGGAFIEINGRYPDKGFAMNEISDEVAYITGGNGKLTTQKETVDFTAGDSLFIPSHEPFYWEGSMTMYVVTSPAFDPTQHKFIGS